jgi:hypothetical protein
MASDGGAGIQRPLSIFSRAAVAMNADRVSPRALAALSIASRNPHQSVNSPLQLGLHRFFSAFLTGGFRSPERANWISSCDAKIHAGLMPLPMFGNIVLIERPLITCLLQDAWMLLRQNIICSLRQPPSLEEVEG